MIYCYFLYIYKDDEIKKENEDPCKASFLDLSIKFHDRKFTTKLFDKRDVFPFYINCMMVLNSNKIANKCIQHRFNVLRKTIKLAGDRVSIWTSYWRIVVIILFLQGEYLFRQVLFNSRFFIQIIFILVQLIKTARANTNHIRFIGSTNPRIIK